MIIIWLIAVYGILAATYLLVFAAASLKKSQSINVGNIPLKRFAVLIPVYREDEVVLESVAQALTLDYPRRFFDVVVIADSLQKATADTISQLGCQVVLMNLKPRSKAKAINLAMSQLKSSDYEYVVVLDADNHLSENALQELNAKFHLGAQAIQCERVAKAITNPLQNLEAISESINNSIFRNGHTAVGLSAALSGSGMAFTYQLFKEAMSCIEATNGFDKDLEFEILSRGVKIEYLTSVSVFDEKVSSVDVLQKQRTRWFAAQIINIKKGIKYIFRKPSLDVLDKWWQMWLPSRLLLAGFFTLMTIGVWLMNWTQLSEIYFGITACLAISLLVATPRRYWNKTLLQSLVKIPISFITLTISLLSIKKAFKGFIHTPHQSHQTKPAQL